VNEFGEICGKNSKGAREFKIQNVRAKLKIQN